jgi:catechol 2,3-dioxygenase-like lactoylglutathione lyase family enzyme
MRRRAFLLSLLVCLALSASAQQLPILGVDAIGMTVADADRSVDFYSRVLHFTKVSDREFSGEEIEAAKGLFGARARVVRMRLGKEEIELTQYLAPEGKPFPQGTRANDRWFQHIAIIVRDMDKAYAELRQHNVRHASSGPQTLPDWNKNAGGIKAFYFRDPDGHFLELLQFPADKGETRWHRPGNELYLGIDHTAITVADTDRSIRFYRDDLGFIVAGTSENYGPEQERLNNVFGARLRITALRPPSGPKIELLEYLAPRDGRDYPTDSKSNDLLHWETRLHAASATAAYQQARKSRKSMISARPANYTGSQSEFLFRDPDGHVLAVSDTKREMANNDDR